MAVECRGRFLEAEVRGSVSYSVNGFQSVQAFHGAAGGGDVFTLQSFGVLREPFACFSGPISDRNCLPLFLLFFFFCSSPGVVQLCGRTRLCVCDPALVQSTVTEVLHLR